MRGEHFDFNEKEQIAEFFSLRNTRQVDSIFNRYGCAMSAAESREMHYFRPFDAVTERLKEMGYGWDCNLKEFPSLEVGG